MAWVAVGAHLWSRYNHLMALELGDLNVLPGFPQFLQHPLLISPIPSPVSQHALWPVFLYPNKGVPSITAAGQLSPPPPSGRSPSLPPNAAQVESSVEGS